MSARRSQKALALAVPLFVEGAALLRSVVLAHAIGAEELGRAMLLGLVLRLAEMLSDMGVDRLLVQAPEGPTPALQASLHGALVLRGVALAAVLLALAAALPGLFPDGPAAGTYAALAVIPLLKGLMHLDYRRAEKGFRYGALARVEGGAALAMLAALGLGIAGGLADHRLMVLALIVQALALTGLSHAVARRAYALSLALGGLRRIVGFGAPLALNAGLMFLTLQADRLIVAGAWGWSDLAVYGIVAQLALLPAQIYGRAANSILLPQFSGVDPAARGPAALRPAQHRATLLGALHAVAFTACAPAAIGLAYGAALAPPAALALALGLAAGLRIGRTPLSIGAVACGRTLDTTRANMWRAAALIPGVALAATGAPLAAFALTAALGELAAWLAARRLFATHSTDRSVPA